ncbi:MAG: cupin domain-containing protein [Acidobacteriota bacterium]
MQEMAALYALGALTQHEARAMKDYLAETRNGLAEDVAAFETVAVNLAFAAPEQAPPPELRQSLLAAIAQETRPSGKIEISLPIASSRQLSEIFSLRANEGEWQEIGPGMLAKTLFVDQAKGTVTSLVRMLPGTALPPHKHLGDEQFYVLEGDCIVHGARLGPGDFHRAAPGTVHETTYTVDGTTFLLIAPANYEILQQAI